MGKRKPRKRQTELDLDHQRAIAAATRVIAYHHEPSPGTSPRPWWYAPNGKTADERDADHVAPECVKTCPWYASTEVIASRLLLAGTLDRLPDAPRCELGNRETSEGAVCWPAQYDLAKGKNDDQD